jgi:hyperosmotically inducible protein
MLVPRHGSVGIVAVSLVAAIVLWLLSIGIGEAAAGKRSDTWVTMKTKIALITEDDIDAMDIRVDTVRGRVTLHGKVTSEREHAKAEEVARKVDGVEDVRNLLQVVSSDSEKGRVAAVDEDLEERIETALDKAPALKGSDISVESVKMGVVQLDGSVNTLAQHLQALEVARSVGGVRQVVSEIKSSDRIGNEEIRLEAEPRSGDGQSTAWPSTAKDIAITTGVKMRLVADPHVPAVEVNVDTHDGVVTLFGMVATEQAKLAAENQAKRVAGVEEVRNGIQVVPVEKQEAVEASDEVIEGRVEGALADADELRTAMIHVEVKNRTVRLSGWADSQSDRLAAGFIARSVRGVRAVQNDLQVETETAADAGY